MRPSYGRSGAPYAQTVRFLEGLETTRPSFFATGAERLTTTTTQVDLVHNMGTDFTPSIGITGFEVSGDNGASWVSATGARLDADSVTLTHADLGTGERLIRYHYGKERDITAPLLDNGALAAPLNFTVGNLVAEGEVALPTLTWANSLSSWTTTENQRVAAIAVPGGSVELLAIVGVTASGSLVANSVTLTAQPSGTPVTATAVARYTAQNGSARINQAVLPVGTTSVTTAVVFAANPFAACRVHISTMPTASLNSTTAVASGNSRTTSATAASVDFETSAGGILSVLGVNRATAGTGSFSGDDSIATRNSAAINEAIHIVGDASNVSANLTSTVTATFTGVAADTRVTAASWR